VFADPTVTLDGTDGQQEASMSLFDELKRRNVLRVGTAYMVTAWLLIEVAETIFPLFGFDDTPARIVVVVLTIGLIPALVLAWAFELTPEGLKKESEIDRTQPLDQRASRNLDRMIMVALALALGYFAVDKFILSESREATRVEDARHEGRTEALVDAYGEKSIAVLPFVNLSSDPAQKSFADGIHDDLLTRISNIRDIKTISRTSVMTYRGSDKKARTIAKELGVSTILEGGVQRSGDQVRINLQLIDAETDAHVWAQTYTRALTATNVFSVQAEITEAVAGALQAVLSEDEQKQVGKRQTSNLQALDAFYMGNQYYNQATSEGYTQAIEAYKTAIGIDREFALAYSKRALAELRQVRSSGLPNDTQLEISRPLIDQAILLDPQSSEAFTALGSWYAHSGDTENAERAYEQAMALGPNNETALVGYGNLIAWNRREPASAIKLFRRAIELDPQNISHRVQLAEVLESVGQADEGIQMMERVIEMQPDSAAAYRVLATIYSDGKFRHDKGIRAMRRAFELDPNHPTNSFMNAVMHWRLADYDNTARWMNHIARLVPNPEEAHVYRGWAFNAQREFESAREEFSLSESDSDFYWLGVIYLGSVDMAEGRPEDAIERFQGYAAKFDGRKSNVNFYYGLGLAKAYLAMGDQGRAQAMLNELLSTIEASPALTYHDSAIHDASVYALSGQEDAAIATLEEWVSRGGATSLLQQDIRHGLSVLADDPRYQSILRTVNRRLSEQRANLAHWESSGEILLIPEVVALLRE
jgi:TolB-like protein/cytochrome c-type biogenesis protein CcmH/NrfG